MSDDPIYQDMIKAWETAHPGDTLIEHADPLPKPDFREVFEATPPTVVPVEDMIATFTPMPKPDTGFLDKVVPVLRMPEPPSHHDKSDAGNFCVACSLPWPCNRAEQPRATALVPVTEWPEFPGAQNN